MLLSVAWCLVTKVSGQPNGLIFRVLDFFTLDDGTGRFSLNVGN